MWVTEPDQVFQYVGAALHLRSNAQWHSFVVSLKEDVSVVPQVHMAAWQVSLRPLLSHVV